MKQHVSLVLVGFLIFYSFNANANSRRDANAVYEAEVICLKRGTGQGGGIYYGTHQYDPDGAARIAMASCERKCDGSCRVVNIAKEE